METKKQKRKRRAFSPEFKTEAVRLCRVGDRTIKQVADDLDLTETALCAWVKRADVDAGKGPPDALVTAEREELARLRRDNKRLTMERDILKAAATHFPRTPTVTPDEKLRSEGKPNGAVSTSANARA